MPGEPVFPHALLREQDMSWDITSSTISPGQTGSGNFPLARLDGGGVWMAQLSSVVLEDPGHIKLWRQFGAIFEGGVVPFILPMCDRRHMPTTVFEGEQIYSYGDIPHSDGSLFSDGTGYAQPLVVAETVGAASLRATTLTIEFASETVPTGGERFSIEHPTQGWRVYEIKTVTALGSGQFTLTIRPPLREAVAAGTSLEFEEPKLVVRLASPDAMNLTLNMRRSARPSPAFVEHIY